MSTITNKQQTTIAEKLATMHLPSGLGDEYAACSIAAINLALSGRLTDSIPACMSRVIGRWIIVTQDAMPNDVRNSERWKSLLPLAAGTGRVNEQERLEMILEWMWGTVLPSVQLLADRQGFGEQWQKMTTERSADAARAAAEAAGAAAEASEWAAWAAARAAGAAAEASERATWEAASEAGAAAARAEAAHRVAGEVADAATAWSNFDPCWLLERLIKIDNNAQGAA